TVQIALCQSVSVMLNGLATCPLGTLSASIATWLQASRYSAGASERGLVAPFCWLALADTIGSTNAATRSSSALSISSGCPPSTPIASDVTATAFDPGITSQPKSTPGTLPAA